MRMDEAAKRRLVGAAVLVALAVVFVPMLVERDDNGLGEPIVIPERPEDGSWSDERAFDAADDEALPEPEDLAMPLPTPAPPPSAAQDDASQAQISTPPPPERAESQAVPAQAERRADASASAARSSQDQATSAPAGPKPVPAGTRAWVVQVASLGSSEAARKMQDALRSKGYPAFVEQANVGGRRYYRVRVGPEIERSQADRLAEQIAADTDGQPLVQRYP